MAWLRKFFLPVLVIVVLFGALAMALRRAPARVDLAKVSRSTLIVTVDEDGRTRVKDRYVVFTPLAGRMERIPLKSGDAIDAGKTILASIEPSDPALLDARAQAETEARVKAAEAALARAEPQVRAANASLELAQVEFERIREAQAANAMSDIELDQKRLTVVMRKEEASAATFARQIAAFELEQAKAALVRTHADGTQDAIKFQIPAPITGRILRVLRDSAGAVASGTPLLEVGDTSRLEIEVDVLSQDAVRIPAGAQVIIERWGGDAPLRGRVRLVEPSGFLKISALGVEEQRVNIIIDFLDEPAARAALGDGYRVEARIIVDEVRDALICPSGALFRSAGGWAAFKVEGGTARLTPVTIGRRNDREVEVLKGLSENDEVVVYPSDRVEDGAPVKAR